MSLSGQLNNVADLDKHFETTVKIWRGKDLDSVGKNVALNVRTFYRQATFGDAPIYLDKSINSELIQIWHYWDKLRGTSKDVAKRRYISYLRSIDKSFVDPIVASKPLSASVDFCRDSKT